MFSYLQSEYPSVDASSLESVIDGYFVYDLSWGPFDIETINAQSTVLISEGMNPLALLEFLIQKPTLQVVHKNNPHFVYNLLACTFLLKEPRAFMHQPLSFFIKDQRFLSNVNFRGSFRSTQSKRILIDEMMGFIKPFKRVWRMRDRINSITDELTTNCLIHGPKDQTASTNNEGAPSSTVEETQGLPSHSPDAEFYLAFNEERLFIAVIDSFGTLDLSNVIMHLYSLYGGAVSSNIKHNIQMGYGFKRVIDQTEHFHIVVKPGFKTFVSASLPLRGKKDDIDSLSRGLHFFKIQ